MALTNAQKAQVFDILGLPQSGSGLSVRLTPHNGDSGSGADGSFDFSTAAAAVGTRLGALSADQVTLVTALLARWNEITPTSPLSVRSDRNGTAADHPGERDAIRSRISNIAGVYVPTGGFIAAARRATSAGETCSVIR